MNIKKEVIAQMRAIISKDLRADSCMLENWARALEQDEQQTPPVAIGQPCAGESSVQPAALIDAIRSKADDQCDKLIGYANSLDIRGETEKAWRVRNEGFGVQIGCGLAIECVRQLSVTHEAEHVAAG